MTRRTTQKQDGPGNKSGRKASRAEVAERVQAVELMFRSGYSLFSIQAIMAKKWGVCHRTTRLYISKVYKEWEKNAVPDEADRILRKQQFEGLLETAMKQSPPNLKQAISALVNLCRIGGHFAPERVTIQQVDQHEFNVEALSQSARDHLRAVVDQMEQAAAVELEPPPTTH